MTFDAFHRTQANWIWSDRAKRPYHNVVCFRRPLALASKPAKATLHLSADARYELFVNGQWLGFGPVRSWHTPWSVDTYDLTPHLQAGANVIAVLVLHPGLSTFQYIHSEPGLIASLAIDEQIVVTDERWRALPHDGFAYPVPRISCMLPWEEQFDARALPDAWRAAVFNDRDWPHAKIVAKAGEGTHASFEARDIPFLTRDEIKPKRLVSFERVSIAPITWSINPRDFLNATDKSAENLRGRLLLSTQLFSEAEQSIQFHQPHGRPFCGWKLNGEPLVFDDHTLQRTETGVAHAKLRAGWNELMAKLPEQEHYWWTVMNAWPERPIRQAATREGATSPTAWLAVGPFAESPAPPMNGFHLRLIDADRVERGATPDRFDTIWQRGAVCAEDAPFTRSVPPYMISPVDVFALCASERVLSTEPNPDATLIDDDWLTIQPGPDARVLLDFGREVIGFHQFEIDAPAGTIVDGHHFEFIQPGDRFNLADGMNNTFRYTCRDGEQTFRSTVRRGFRYTWLTFRQFDRPIRVRRVRLLMSTYPQRRGGAFESDDPLLNDIWQVGVQSVECCSEDTYTDCPTYEQTFWVGDARNEALVDLVANGDPRLSARSLRLAARSLERSSLTESQVPSGWQNILPAWSWLWMRWAQEHVDWTGDLALGRELVGWIGRNVDGIEASIGPCDLIDRRAWNLFDWAPMDTPARGEVTHVSALAVLALRQAAKLADWVDANADATRWRAIADRLTAAINSHCWDDTRQAYVDCIHVGGRRSEVFSQQTQTAAYIAEVATGDRGRRCLDIMLNAPSGFVTAGSPFFMFFLLEGLAREGRFDAMVKTIRDYWGQQIRSGATTFWETYTPDQPRWTRSHCHGWSAAPTYFLTRYLLGVSPDSPGLSRVRIAPQPGAGGVRQARGKVPSPRGVIECAWHLDAKENFELSLVLPPTVVAKVEIPLTGKVEILDGADTAIMRTHQGLSCTATGKMVLRVVR